ncbi:nitroreductase family deazaflavin-dependent oxidoreductase [Pseudonocardia sp. C8]|nr:nitroreductase family deazaflavin-dependent oxidoreductase [Pseudonocardia sp. C8]
MLLEVTGRKSGRRYTIPIAYGEHGHEVLIGVAEARWLHNLTPDRPVTATVRGRRRELYPQRVTDEDTVAALYPHIVAGNRAHARFQQLRVGPDGSVHRDDLRRALARGLALIRLRPA